MRSLPWLIALSLLALAGCSEDPRASALAAIEAQRQPAGRSSAAGSAPSAVAEARDLSPSAGNQSSAGGSEGSAAEPRPHRAQNASLEGLADSLSAPRAAVSAGATAGASGADQAQAPLQLTTRLMPSDAGARLEWTLENVSPGPIYVFAVLPGWRDGAEVPDFEAVYVRRRAETLHLSRRLWRIPANLRVFRPEVPYLVRIAPGRAERGGFVLPREVSSRFPYAFGASSGGATERLVLSFGYLDPEVQTGVHEAAAPGLFRVEYAPGLAAQRTVESEALTLRLVVAG